MKLFKDFMTLKIFTLKKPVLSRENVLSINLKTVIGEITVLDNHRPYITIIEKGIVKITTTDNKTEDISLSGGILEVLPKGTVNILSNN